MRAPCFDVRGFEEGFLRFRQEEDILREFQETLNRKLKQGACSQDPADNAQ